MPAAPRARRARPRGRGLRPRAAAHPQGEQRDDGLHRDQGLRPPPRGRLRPRPRRASWPSTPRSSTGCSRAPRALRDAVETACGRGREPRTCDATQAGRSRPSPPARRPRPVAPPRPGGRGRARGAGEGRRRRGGRAPVASARSSMVRVDFAQARPPAEPGRRADRLPHEAQRAGAAGRRASLPGARAGAARGRPPGGRASRRSCRRRSWTCGCCRSATSSSASRAWCATSRASRASRSS